jgi:hypothetical protein
LAVDNNRRFLSSASNMPISAARRRWRLKRGGIDSPTGTPSPVSKIPSRSDSRDSKAAVLRFFKFVPEHRRLARQVRDRLSQPFVFSFQIAGETDHVSANSLFLRHR